MHKPALAFSNVASISFESLTREVAQANELLFCILVLTFLDSASVLVDPHIHRAICSANHRVSWLTLSKHEHE